MIATTQRWLQKSALLGSGGIFAQAVVEPSAYERLGTAGLLVAAAYFMLRYFMGELSKKDALVNDLVREQREAYERNTNILIEELRQSAQTKIKLDTTMQELIVSVRGRRPPLER